MSASPSPIERAERLSEEEAWPAMPVETEIYVLTDGRVVIADLPHELSALAAALGAIEPCAVEPAVPPALASQSGASDR